MYFPFPSPPKLISPPQRHPHDGVNFFHSSPIPQFHTFEYLNMENMAHHLNNSKKKEKKTKK